MKFRWNNRYLHMGVTAFMVAAASILFYYGIFHMKTLISGIHYILGILAPITYGIAIAFLLSPVLNFFEKKLVYPLLEKKGIQLQKKGQKAVRWIGVIICVALLLFSIYALVMMILPELIRSITNFIYSFPDYVSAIRKFLESVVTDKGWDLDDSALDLLNTSAQKAQTYLTNTILPQMQGMLKNVSAGFLDILTFLKNFIIGAVVSLYLLADKEKFVAKGKMLAYGLFPADKADFLIRAMRFTSKTFIGFITGKILDSAIIGVLCYIGTMALGMPYATLVSVVVGVTNVIPFFGPYLGAIPCILLILLVNPLKALYFSIFILALQQFDGNILGPKILGDSTGLSSFMVIVAILIGGGLFGIPGMIIGVPVFAVLYAAFNKILQHLLADKKYPQDETVYCGIDRLNTSTREPIYFSASSSIQFAAKEAKKKATASAKPMSDKKQKSAAMQDFLKTLWVDLKELGILIWTFLKLSWAKARVLAGNIRERISRWVQAKSDTK